MKSLIYRGFPFTIEINPINGYLDAQIHAHGLYEPHIIKIMEKHIAKNAVCIDVGANIGHHTILMSHFVGKHGHVHAYEPIPAMREQMQRSFDANNIHNITIHDVALSDSKGEMQLYLRKGNIGASSLVEGIDTSGITVRVIPLDMEYQGTVDFMKIDVEGYEYHVLMGGKALIEKHRPVIIFEWSPVYYRIHDESHAKNILQFFLDMNYTLTDTENNNKIISDIDMFVDGFNEGLRSQTNILALPL
jgi:FkbM family methyltransferase